MKNLFILLVLALSITSCSTEEIAETKSQSTIITPNTEVAQPQSRVAPVLNLKTTIEITAVTRGFSSSIVVNNSKLTKSSTGIVPPMTITITAAKWNVLKQKFALLSLSSIATYVAPTCASCSDAGFAETLKITHNGVTYTSQSYDSSNAPTQLRSFLTYVKSIN